MSKHVAIWIDHKEARVFAIQPDKVAELVLEAPNHTHHRHPKGPSGESNHPDDAKHFFHDVASSLEGAEQVLIVGPSTAKLQFLKYLQAHDHPVGPKVVGIETVDHPTDGQLVAYARAYFERTDRMH